VSPVRAWPWVLAALAAAGCDNMQHQENVRAYEPSKFFADGASARTPPAHAVSRDDPAPDDPVAHGRLGGAWATAIPLRITRALVERGRQRYGIYCAECHGADGYGQGIVVRRGFPAPPSFHGPRERGEPAGQVFEVLSRGQGVMYGYADRIVPADRWAIVAYIRALQRSQNATVADLPPGERRRLLLP
jgi:mono/diheme cytochrome c family protein